MRLGRASWSARTCMLQVISGVHHKILNSGTDNRQLSGQLLLHAINPGHQGVEYVRPEFEPRWHLRSTELEIYRRNLRRSEGLTSYAVHFAEKIKQQYSLRFKQHKYGKVQSREFHRNIWILNTHHKILVDTHISNVRAFEPYHESDRETYRELR
jgi:hypothetical protein